LVVSQCQQASHFFLLLLFFFFIFCLLFTYELLSDVVVGEELEASYLWIEFLLLVFSTWCPKVEEQQARMAAAGLKDLLTAFHPNGGSLAITGGDGRIKVCRLFSWVSLCLYFFFWQALLKIGGNEGGGMLNSVHGKQA